MTGFLTETRRCQHWDFNWCFTVQGFLFTQWNLSLRDSRPPSVSHPLEQPPGTRGQSVASYELKKCHVTSEEPTHTHTRLLSYVSLLLPPSLLNSLQFSLHLQLRPWCLCVCDSRCLWKLCVCMKNCVVCVCKWQFKLGGGLEACLTQLQGTERKVIIS